MTLRLVRSMRRWAVLGVISILSACGGGDGGQVADPPQASTSDVTTGDVRVGLSPFIRFVHLSGKSLSHVKHVTYSITPKPGASAQAVSITYSAAGLKKRGYFSAPEGGMVIPVFGLYANHNNTVNLAIEFQDASVQEMPASIATPAYVDPNLIYDHPEVLKQRQPSQSIGFNYFILKSYVGAPIVMDTDGEVRWVGPPVPSGFHSVFTGNGLVVGEPTTVKVHRMEFDGVLSTASVLGPPSLTKFHHNMTVGKTALLAMFDAEENGVANLETIIAEITASGAVLKLWNLAEIISEHMGAGGDDPTLFVRPGIDWFHSNDVIYDSSDDSLIISSRENFVIKIGYATGDVRWILGDPTKYWYSFPSLRAKALQLTAGGNYPVGQHALSLLPDGQILLFNNGRASLNAPSGAPIGVDMAYSAVGSYRIDPETKQATETSRFEYDKSILSRYCSSAYQSKDGSMLVNYAQANNDGARIVGLDPGKQIVFDIKLPNTPNTGCNTSWNAGIVPFENMVFD